MSATSPYVQPAQPIDRARDVIARRIEQQFPGWAVTHGPYGFSAARPGWEPIRRLCSMVLTSLIAEAERQERMRLERDREQRQDSRAAAGFLAAS